MNIEENFNDFYNSFLISNKEDFDKIEIQQNRAIKERKNNKKIIIMVEITLLTIIILWTIIFGWEEDNVGVQEWCGLAGFLFPMIIALKKRQKLEEYEDVYQNKIIKKLIQHFSPKLEYYPNETISDEEYRKMGIQNFNEFNSSNIIRGIYKNNEITISKIITKYISSRISYEGISENGINTRRKTSVQETFDGIFIKAKLSQNMKTDLYIKSKVHLNEKAFNNFIESIEGKEYCKIDDNELNNIFNIYSSNLDVNIRMLDSEMKSILIDIYNRQKFEIVIKDDYIYIRFWIVGLFSNPQLERKTNDKEILYKNYKMLYLVFYLLTKIEEKI